MKIEKILESIWNEFIYGGHFTAMAAVGVVLLSAVLLNIKITLEFLLVVYSGTMVAYLYNRYKELGKDCITDPERTEYLAGHLGKIPWIIAFFSVIFFSILLIVDRVFALVIAAFLFFLSFSYSIFLKKITSKIIVFKSLIVSFVWASLVIFLAIYYSFFWQLSIFLIFIFVYLRTFVHEEFLNIKDIKGDKKEKLLTLPIMLNERKLCNILLIITILSIIPIFYGIYMKLFPYFSIIFILIIPYTSYYLKLKKRTAGTLIYYTFGDLEYVFWSVLIIMSKLFLQ